MKVCSLIAALIVTTTAAFAQAPERSSLDRGITLWMQNNQERALTLFHQATVEQPDNPDAWAWIAEALRRADSMGTSHSMARRALQLSPCHPQAHTTLADLYSPQFSSWDQTSHDSTWHHYMTSVECDPDEGNAWFGLWIEAMRTGRIDIEKKALKSLVSTGFITPGALAYARWMLASLPPNAILLTYGDMDTYPLVALQETGSFRTDVAVINASLLDMQWYAALMTTRHGISGGYTAAEIEGLQQSDVEQIAIYRQVIARWIDADRRGTLKRPIAIAGSVMMEDLVDDMGTFTIAGPYWLHTPASGRKPYDAATLWGSLRPLEPNDFAGSFISLRDRSPIRQRYSAPVAGGTVTRQLWGVVEALKGMGAEGISEAEKLEAWITSFDIAAGVVAAD